MVPIGLVLSCSWEVERLPALEAGLAGTLRIASCALLDRLTLGGTLSQLCSEQVKQASKGRLPREFFAEPFHLYQWRFFDHPGLSVALYLLQTSYYFRTSNLRASSAFGSHSD